MQKVSDYELELLRIIWQNGGRALYADISRVLEERDTPWTKNTIITLLSRLVDKGYIKTSKLGHRNEYTALVTDQEYQSGQTEAFLTKVYEGNAKGLVSTLIQKDLLTVEEYEELKQYWMGGEEQE